MKLTPNPTLYLIEKSLTEWKEKLSQDVIDTWSWMKKTCDIGSQINGVKNKTSTLETQPSTHGKPFKTSKN